MVELSLVQVRVPRLCMWRNCVCGGGGLSTVVGISLPSSSSGVGTSPLFVVEESLVQVWASRFRDGAQVRAPRLCGGGELSTGVGTLPLFVVEESLVQRGHLSSVCGGAELSTGVGTLPPWWDWALWRR